MIPRDFITEWRVEAPWVADRQVEQDLVISRALIEFFSRDAIAEGLAFRGGTALYKLLAPDLMTHSGPSRALFLPPTRRMNEGFEQASATGHEGSGD